MMTWLICLVLTAVSLVQVHGSNTKSPRTRILILADYSLSMSTRWERRTKIVVLRQALLRVTSYLERNHPEIELGLRLFGHRSPEDWKDCRDTRLEVPIGKGTHSRIRSAIEMYSPRGVTPLAYALSQAARDFGSPAPGIRNVIIVITDGIDACGGDVCAAFSLLQKSKIAVKPFLIGMNLPDEAFGVIACAGVTAYNAKHESELEQYLQKIIDRVVALSSIDVALLDHNNKPTETDLPMLFIRTNDSSIAWGGFHTLNNKGVPDTLYLDPLYEYILGVYGLPPVIVNTVNLIPGKHKHISIPYPTGMLQVALEYKTLKEDVGGKIKALIRLAEQKNTSVVTSMGTRVRLRQDDYIVEVTTLPVVKKNVRVSSGYVTTVNIKEPGVLVIELTSDGYGSVVCMSGPSRWESIYQLYPGQRRIVLVLMPGDYRVIFRPQTAGHTERTVVKEVHIKSGDSHVVSLP